MKKKFLLLLIIFNIFIPCYAIDIQAIKTNTSFEEVAHINKLEQIKINEVPRTTYTPKNLRTQYMMSFQGRDKNNTMVWWSNTFTDYDTKTIKSEIINNTYYIEDNLGNSFITGEHTDLTPITSSIEILNTSTKKLGKSIDILDMSTKTNSENIKKLGQRMDMYAQDIDRIDGRMNNLENNMYSGLATVTALTSLHPNPRSRGIIDVSLGTGIYRDECAGAVGVFIHPTENLMIQGGASMGDNSYAGFVGLTFSFGKRKD